MRWGIIAASCWFVLAGCQSLSPEATPANPVTPVASTALETAPDTTVPPVAEPTKVAAETAPATEPEPITDIWLRIQQGLHLPDVDNEKVRVQRDWYIRNQAYMDRVAERADWYLFHIVESLEAAGMPLDLALLPIVESAYQPYAYSRSRAAGMWQFIPSTGRLYGLPINWWQDGRRDVVRSTDAAIRYLKRLNQMFDGDWLLAMAAYNGGEGTIMRAMEKNRKKGLPTDFWSLDLRTETSAYVPKMIALSQLLREPEKYGFNWKPVQNEVRFARVAVGSQIDLKLAAELAGISSDTLYQLNPHYVRWATDPEGPHDLLVPVDKAEQFQFALQNLPVEKRVQWGVYTVKSGDTLGGIASKHKTSVAQLRSTNNLKGNLINIGQTLLIPRQGGQPNKDTRLAAESSSPRPAANGIHTVREGENLWSIARANGLSVNQLRMLNKLAEGDLLKPGQLLKVHSDAKLASAASTRSKEEIQLAANPHLSVKKIQYTVRNGDSLSRIADKFSVSVSDLSKWNRWDKKKALRPGQKLTVYVDQANLSGG